MPVTRHSEHNIAAVKKYKQVRARLFLPHLHMIHEKYLLAKILTKNKNNNKFVSEEGCNKTGSFSHDAFVSLLCARSRAL